VTDKGLSQLLARLPVEDRLVAEQKVVWARKCGWTYIGLWEALPGFPSHHEDLVGVMPNGKFDFLPEPKDFDTFIIE
jgi:hypothetical protein